MGAEQEQTRFQRFVSFMYDSEKGEVLGRTGRSWGLIGLFFLIFYICLGGFFVLNMVIFDATLNDYRPRYYGKHSIMGGNPGLGFEPFVDVEKTLIWFRSSKEGAHTYKPYVDQIATFLRPYDADKQQDEHFFDCDSQKPPVDRVCRFEVKKRIGNKVCQLGTDDFGYNVGNPCIYITLNKIYGWEPELYTSASDPDLQNAPPSVRNNFLPDHIPVSCDGEYAADKEYIGNISYYPAAGLPANFYPYINTPGYLQPFVAIQLMSPQRNTLINIECTAWAKNIENVRAVKRGIVHFEIMID